MKKILAVLVLVLGFGLSACGTSEGAQDIEACTNNGGYGAGCPRELQYEGETLYCVSWDGSHGETGLDCDWVRYHKENG